MSIFYVIIFSYLRINGPHRKNIFQLRFYNYSVIPSMGFYFFSVCSGLDPAKSCVFSNETPMKVLNSIWKLRHL